MNPVRPPAPLRPRATLLHGADYNPDQWLEYPEVLEEDFRLMREAGCNTFSVGIFSWSRCEPSPGDYQFDWLDRIMDRMAAEDFYVNLATPSGALPLWLTKNHPECVRMNPDGRRAVDAGRHNFCRNAPALRQHVRAINTELARRYARHPALAMWHVSNELQGECHCPHCAEKFSQWLRARHGSLDALNHAYWSDFWSHRIASWTDLPRDYVLDGLLLDRKRFASDDMADYVDFEAEPLVAANPEVPIVTNLMGLHPQISYHRLARAVSLVADDQYPQFDAESPDFPRQLARSALTHDLMRCLKGESRPWLLMESDPEGRVLWRNYAKLKRPGLHHLQMLQTIAHGADGVMYFQWRKSRGAAEKDHGAVVGHYGGNRGRVFNEVAALGARLQKLSAVRDTRVEADTALVFDWDAWWAYNLARGNFGSQTPNTYVDVALEHYFALWQRGISVDVVPPHADLSRYKLVLCPMLYALRDGFAERLAAYVHAGGHAVLSAYSGFNDEHALWFRDGCPGAGLGKVFGVWLEEIDQPRPHERVTVRFTDGSEAQAADFIGHLHAEGATVLATHVNGLFVGQPCATRHTHGRGTAWFLASRLDEAGQRLFYDPIIAASGAAPALTNLPSGVIARRRTGENGRFVFLMNSTAETRVCPLPAEHTDLETGEHLTSVRLAPFAVHVLREP